MLYLDGEASSSLPVPGFVAELGIVPESWEPGTVRLRWTPPAWTRTPPGWVQGGFLGVPMDMAMSFAVVTLVEEGKGAVTLDMSTKFLEVPMGESFLVTGTVTRLGGTVAFTEARIEEASGKLVASSSATNMVRNFYRPQG